MKDIAVGTRLVALFPALIAFALTGCTPRAPTAEASDRTWAAEIAAEHEDATGTARAVLEDGTITQQEYEEIAEEIATCLRALKVDAELVEGAWQYTRPDSVGEEKVDECIESLGGRVLTLRDAMERNPTNIDEDRAMAKCLVRAELVAPGYTKKDYLRELSAGTYSFDVGTPAFAECVENPF